jgi:hypothetical protein
LPINQVIAFTYDITVGAGAGNPKQLTTVDKADSGMRSLIVRKCTRRTTERVSATLEQRYDAIGHAGGANRIGSCGNAPSPTCAGIGTGVGIDLAIEALHDEIVGARQAHVDRIWRFAAG